MKHFLHILATGLAALSLLLFVAAIVLWVRSYLVADMLTSTQNDMGDNWAWNRTRQFASARGRAAYYHGSARSDDLSSLDPQLLAAHRQLIKHPAVRHSFRHETRKPPTGAATFGLRTRLGFGLNWESHSSGRVILMTAPYWAITATFALAPAAWAWRIRQLKRKRRIDEARCLRCGYDLRATPAQCPECGAIPKPSPR